MPCKNNAAFSYTGKEMSPLGLGFCADAESVNREMVGRDGKSWVVGVKNGNKMWMRAPEPVLVKEEPVLPKETVNTEPIVTEEPNEEPVLPKETVTEEPVVDSDGEELPPLEEMTEVEEEALEDPFGWTPTDSLEVTEESKAEEEPKDEVKEAPKKRGRPAKPKAEKETKESSEEPKKRGRPAKPKAEKVEAEESNDTPKKRGRPAKPKAEKEEKPVELNENGEVVKTKRKYTRKPKLVEGEIVVEEVEKKERKPRAKTEYNEFLGKTMKELREKHKDNTELKTTDYMKMAIAEWKTYKISKVGV
jgi:hypothetical protein